MWENTHRCAAVAPTQCWGQRLRGFSVLMFFFFTFSNNCLSCLVRASREHMDCWGATTVQTHLPSLSWAELYTCHDSSGFAGNTWRKEGGHFGIGVHLPRSLFVFIMRAPQIATKKCQRQKTIYLDSEEWPSNSACSTKRMLRGQRRVILPPFNIWRTDCSFKYHTFMLCFYFLLIRILLNTINRSEFNLGPETTRICCVVLFRPGSSAKSLRDLAPVFHTRRGEEAS